MELNLDPVTLIRMYLYGMSGICIFDGKNNVWWKDKNR